jgi:hypothetical protein
MIRMRRPGTVCRITAVSLITALVFCEFLVYYITLYSCAYPELGEERRGEEDELRVMVLADTHLLGKYRTRVILKVKNHKTQSWRFQDPGK